MSSGTVGLWGALGAGLGSWKFKVASELIDITARWLVRSRHGFDFKGKLREERARGSLWLAWLENGFFRLFIVGRKGRNKATA